eukprot:TCONS_00054022-protein
MSYPISLSVTGKPSPRTNHPANAGHSRTPMTANRSRNQKSNIFCLGSENLDQEEKAKAKHRSSGVVTKSELEAIKNLTSRANRPTREDQRAVEANRSPSKPPPKGVPKLSLDDVVGAEEDNSYSKLPAGIPKVHSPTSLDSCSWGTPIGYPPQRKPIKGGGWQVNQSRRPVRSATSSQRKRDDVPDLDLKLSQTNEGLGQLRKVAQEVREDLNIEYMGASHIADNEKSKKGRSKKQEFIEDAILQDQVSRMKLSEEKEANQRAYGGGPTQPFDSRMKRVDQLFNTKSMVTGTHEDLSNRFRFSARILSLNGRDALRELNGFFFIVDNTLTLYEFRQFGSRANATPFIQRGQYSHISGFRKNRQYHLMDIGTGKNLTFDTKNQPSLSDGLKAKSTITIRITDTDDEETRKKLLYHGCKTSKEKEMVKRFVDDYMRAETNDSIVALKQLQAKMRHSLKTRGTKMMTSLFYHFKMVDKSGDGLLSKEEIKTTFQKFRVQVQEHEFNLIWKLIDENNDEFLDYGEFTRGFFGEMTEHRKKWVRKAFTRLDTSSSGVGEATNFYKFFCPSKHPSVIKGELSEENLMNNMEEIFQITRRKRDIHYSIFEAFYEGVSLSVTSDEGFTSLIRSTWSM